MTQSGGRTAAYANRCGVSLSRLPPRFCAASELRASQHVGQKPGRSLERLILPTTTFRKLRGTQGRQRGRL
jgi:hypothetical protein